MTSRHPQAALQRLGRRVLQAHHRTRPRRGDPALRFLHRRSTSASCALCILQTAPGAGRCRAPLGQPFQTQLTNSRNDNERRSDADPNRRRPTDPAHCAKGQDFEDSLDPMQLLTEASKRALADTGAADKLRPLIDNISVVRFTADSSEIRAACRSDNTRMPRARSAIASAPRRGANTTPPPEATHRNGLSIARRRKSPAAKRHVALLAGSEDLATLIGALNKGVQLKWGEDAGGEPIHIGDNRRGSNEVERGARALLPGQRLSVVRERHSRPQGAQRSRPPIGDRPAVFSVLKSRVGKSVVLVSDAAHTRRNCDPGRQQPLCRISLHEIYERHDPGGHGGGRRDDERENRTRIGHSRVRNGSICTVAPTRPTFGMSASA